MRGVPADGRAPTPAAWIAAGGAGEVLLSFPAEIVRRPALRAGNGSNLPWPAGTQRFLAPEGYVALLPDATLSAPDAIPVSREGIAFLDHARAWGRSVEDHPCWQDSPRQPKLLPGLTGSIAARGAATNFSHFLADSLPRLQLIRDAGVEPDRWLVSSTSSEWQADWLARCGLPTERILALDRVGAVRCERLVLTGPTGFAPLVAPWARGRLRALLSPPNRDRERLLVSRRCADRRQLGSEAELEQFLAPHGIRPVILERLASEQQIAAMANAELLVGMHGAGLSHLLYAREGGRLIEIGLDGEVHPEYPGLAALANWTHTLVPARASGQSPVTLASHEVDVETVADAVAKSFA